MPFRMIDELAEVWWSGLKWRSITSECFWVPPLGSFLTEFHSEITMRLFTLCNEPLLYLRTPKSATMIKCVSLVMLFPLSSHYLAKQDCSNHSSFGPTMLI